MRRVRTHVDRTLCAVVALQLKSVDDVDQSSERVRTYVFFRF